MKIHDSDAAYTNVNKPEDAVNRLVMSDDRLWSWSDIVKFWGYDDATARRKRNKCGDDFPHPIIQPGGGKRWVAQEVRNYLKSLPRGMT
jgi:predicted DNA-binding transcriptional regulator AlpA